MQLKLLVSLEIAVQNHRTDTERDNEKDGLLASWPETIEC